jgi:Tfp pilus assembly PilM family ATPase
VPAELSHQARLRHEWQIQTIKKALNDLSFKGKKAVACLPSEKHFIQQLKLEKLSDAKQNMQLAHEAQEKIPFDLQRALLHHIIAGNAVMEPDHQEVIVIATDQESIAEHLDIMDRAKVNIESLNIQLTALVTAFLPALDPQQTTMLLDIGTQVTQVIVCDGRQPRFYRHLPISISQLASGVRGDINDEIDNAVSARKNRQRLKNELLNCLRYDSLHFDRPAPHGLILSGEVCHHPELMSYIGESLGIQTYSGNAAALAIGNERLNGELSKKPCDWNVAFGLCLLGMASTYVVHGVS